MNIVDEFTQKRFVDILLFITCYFKLFFEPFILHNYKLLLLLLNKFQDHVFICSI